MDPIYIGQIMPWPLSWAPCGWMFCAGQVLNNNIYQGLYYVIGNTYGGNPSNNTFQLPDLQGFSPIGACTMPGPGLANTYPLATTSGSATQSLNTSQMPLHLHASLLNLNSAVSLSLIVSTDPATSSVPVTGMVPAAGSSPSNNGTGPVEIDLYGDPTRYSFLENAVNANLSVTGLPQGMGPAGSGEAHNNVQPYIALNYIIAYIGTIPPFNS